MKIGFDAKRAFSNTSGLGNYSRGVIESLNAYHPTLDLHLFTPKKTNNSDFGAGNNIHLTKTRLKSLERVFRTASQAKNVGVDVFHGLTNELPIGLGRKGIKSVVTIHDLIFLKFPQYYKPIDRAIYLAKTKYAIKHADLIITTSNQTKTDIEQHFPTANNCKTVYQHVSQFKNNARIVINEAPYLIYISSFEKRKNHLILLKAFNAVSAKTSINLVLIGRPKETLHEINSFIKDHHLKERVKVIPNAESQLIQSYLKQAEGFIYPSVYEGFGIPLLEALQFNLSIACSDLPVFREIAEEYANYFDPFSQQAIENAILTLSEGKKKEISTEIDLYLKKFSPETHANRLLESYQSLIK